MATSIDVNEETILSWELPDAVTEDLQAGLRMTLLRAFAGWLIWLIMVAGFGVGAFYIWPYFERLDSAVAIARALEANGLLYYTNFGFSLLVWLFGWILLSAALAGLVVRLVPSPYKFAVFLSVLADSGGMPSNKKALYRLLEAKTHSDDTNRFINEWVRLFVRTPLKYGLLLFCIGAVFLWRETYAYDIYSETGYVSAPFFPWSTSGETPWSQANYVELGCNQTDDGPSFVYKVYFRSGESVRISGADPVKPGRWVEGLERIDRQLAMNGTEFRRWSWTNRDPLHPKCIRGYYASLGPNLGGRLINLLRIEELGSDPVAEAEGS